MKKNIKYLKAAELVIAEDGIYETKDYNNPNIMGCCKALISVKLRNDKFVTLFSPEEGDGDCYFWWGVTFTKKAQLQRSLALLFMYEMGEK